MPHYKDGTEAKVGDVVKGKGYNVKHEIVGIVTAIKPGESTCNVTIACVAKSSHVPIVFPGYLDKDGGMSIIPGAAARVESIYEYGQADAFEKIA